MRGMHVALIAKFITQCKSIISNHLAAYNLNLIKLVINFLFALIS